MDISPLNTKNLAPFKYRECLKNHAASIGGNAIDGCGEFMPSGEEGTLEALKCSACNCHRNFHRKEMKGKTFMSQMIIPLTSMAKKRFRTKFSVEQKEKMLQFAEAVGWRVKKEEEKMLEELCEEIGIKRRVLKVWMHNNKNNLGKKNNSILIQ